MKIGLKIFLVVSLLFPSCLTVRQIERNCDKFAQICITDTQETTIIHDTVFVEKRDTVVDYRLERDTVFQRILIPSAGLSINSDTSYIETGLANSTAYIWRSELYHYLESGDTILNIRLNDAITEINRLHTELNKKVQTVTVQEDTPFGKFAKWWFFGTFVLIVLGVVWKIRG